MEPHKQHTLQHKTCIQPTQLPQKRDNKDKSLEKMEKQQTKLCFNINQVKYISIQHVFSSDYC